MSGMVLRTRKVMSSRLTPCFHGGHIEIIKKAEKLGKLIIGVLSDEAVAGYKRFPLVSARERKKLFANIAGVYKVMDQNSLSYKENLESGIYYSDREKANLVTETYYDRKDSNGNRRPWYTSSYYSDAATGYMINFYYADGILFFADAYIPGERSSVTFYFWGNQMFACHDLRYSGSRLSFSGDADYDRIVREFGNLSLHAS